MLTCLGIGCFGLVVLAGLAVIGLFLIGLDEEVPVTEKVIDVTVEACYDGEMFNEVEQICMLPIVCEGVDECTRWGDGVITRLNQAYGPLDDFTYADDVVIEETILAEYDVYNNVVQDEVEEPYLWQWHDFEWMTPDDYTKMIDYIEIFEGNETNAYVKVGGGTTATLGLNIEPFIPSETLQNNVHELAHLFSLEQAQADYSVTEENCDTLYTEEGACFYEGSYMYAFYEQFWADGSLSDAEYFITDYAMSHEQEDFAESFTYFVLYKKPTTNTVVDQKLLFFYQYEEMVELRTQLLARIATWLPRHV